MIAIDTVPERLEVAASCGAAGRPPHRGRPARRRQGRHRAGAASTSAVDAVGHPDALDLAARVTRKAGDVSAIGVYAERIQVHMGIVWIKALTLRRPDTPT